ncbi:MAG: CPBP family intramembrane glutamic endopeptidase [Rubrobacteraceae bacterium]
MGPRFVRLAAIFYGSLVAAAALWNGLRGRDFSLTGDSTLVSLALGVLTAVCTVLLGLVVYRLAPVMREIADELAPRLVDGVPVRDLMLLSLFSGVGEEAFFRGAVQPEFGILVASIVFGLVHIGPDRRYLAWTVWALFAGFLFGALYIVTGGILAPVVAHVSHNAATFVLWKRSRRGRGEVKPP